MKLAKVIGRVFCSRQDSGIDKKTLLLIQPLRWEDESVAGDPIVAADAVGAGSSEKVFWVASREAAVAFKDVPPIDAAVVGIVDGHQVRDFRGTASLSRKS
jgi:ethanolamine utilization protein EutN